MTKTHTHTHTSNAVTENFHFWYKSIKGTEKREVRVRICFPTFAEISEHAMK